MRETATLTRPTTGPSSWNVTGTPRFALISRPIVRFGLLLVVGLGFGFLASRLLLPAPPRQVSTAEYVAVVAQLYQQDHNVAVARERLQLFGPATDLARQAQQVAGAGRLTTTTDSVAVDLLASALAGPATPAASPSSGAGVVTPAVDPATLDSGDRLSWIGPVIAFVMAFALGIIVLLRTAGITLSFIKIPGINGPERKPRGPTSRSRPFTSKLWDESGSQRTAVSISEVNLDQDGRAGGGSDDEDRVEDARARSVAVQSRLTGTRTRRAPVFQSTYRIGDDPFDEIHPISDPANGSLVAACGMSAALKLDSVDIGGYYAFTAWVQDYVNGEDLHAAGLVTPGAPDTARSQIESWVRGGQIDTVLPLERGSSARIGAPNLTATVTVVDIGYGQDGGSNEAFVTRLTVRFDVDLDNSTAARPSP